MRLDDIQESGNVQDRRSAGRRVAGGGIMSLVFIALIVYLQGGNLGDFLKLAQQQQPVVRREQRQAAPALDAAEEKQRVLVSKVLKLTEDVWGELFQEEYGLQYEKPKLEIFRGRTATACGAGSAAMGPFYCPADKKVYIDLGFYDQLADQLHAGGDFAQAYVVAHEIGHHVQNQLGYSQRVQQRRSRLSKEQANQDSVRLELQADYLAGVWAYHAQKEFNILEQGDIEEGLNAAFQIGDDTLQKQSRGVVVPEQFTHGSSKQRVRWFREGLKTGDASRKKLDYFFDPRAQL